MISMVLHIVYTNFPWGYHLSRFGIFYHFAKIKVWGRLDIDLILCMLINWRKWYIISCLNCSIIKADSFIVDCFVTLTVMHFIKNLLMIIVELYTKGFYDFNHDFTS